MAKKPLRSPERAAAVLDRAAKMAQYKPALQDRGLFSKKMRTPGLVEAPFSMMSTPGSALEHRGAATIPLSKIKTEQPTVSLGAAKSKLASVAAGAGEKPHVVRHGDLYYLADGNHRVTAARALGKESIKAHVFDFKANNIPVPASVKPVRAYDTRLSTASKVGMAAAAVTPVVAGVNAWNSTKAKGGDQVDAMAAAAGAGLKTAAVGAAAGATFHGIAKAAQMLAPRIAPTLGPVGWVATAGMAGYGAYQGYQNTGTIGGALKGAIGLDTTTAALAATQAQQPAPGKAAAAGGKGNSMSTADASRFERANANFSANAVRDLAASVGKTEGGQKGWANASNQFAAQAARGVQNFTDWAQQGETKKGN